MLSKLKELKKNDNSANNNANNNTTIPEPDNSLTSQIIYEETFLDDDGNFDKDIRGRVIKRAKTGSEAANKSIDETLNLSSINDLTAD